MSNTGSFNLSLLEIKIPLDPGAHEKMRSRVLTRLEDIYGNPLPEIVLKRINEELSITKRNGYAPFFLTHQKVIRSAENFVYPFFLKSHNGAFLINFALGISKANPLPPHHRCESCKHSEFIADNSFDTGFLLPAKHCPICGETMIGDGQNLNIESFLGYRHDKYPSLSLCVPSEHFDTSVSCLENAFNARRKDLNDFLYSYEEGFVFVEIYIEQIENWHPGNEVLNLSEMDDPGVFEYLSRPESYGCYLPRNEYSATFAKELLKTVNIEHCSDLFKICGLIHSYTWLGFILPRLKNDVYDYRETITVREDIYRYLTQCGIEPETSFKVMEMTRKGRAKILFEDERVHQLLLTHGVTEDYINCLKNIPYLLSKAQAIEYAMIAYRNAWSHLHN